MKYTLSKKKPPKTAKCEAGTTNYDSKFPEIKICGKPATVELCGGLPWETWVCQECADQLLSSNED